MRNPSQSWKGVSDPTSASVGLKNAAFQGKNGQMCGCQTQPSRDQNAGGFGYCVCNMEAGVKTKSMAFFCFLITLLLLSWELLGVNI